MADQTTPIFLANYSVTGIRSMNAANTQVFLTGSCPPSNNQTQGMIYIGPLIPTNSSGGTCVLPPGADTAVFYGPDTPLFTPTIPSGSIRLVGSYRSGAGYDQGVLYEGPPDGSGKFWKTINMHDEAPNRVVANTILHSTMGELIAGNYDLQGDELGKFNAFIYNIRTHQYQKLKPLLMAELGTPVELITAYGIWQNGIGNTHYTIAGGLYDGNARGLNVGYLVDYDSDKNKTSNLKTFSYNNDPSLITHFEGITECSSGSGCFSLAATGDKNKNHRGAAFAMVKRNPDGSFGEASWQRVQGPTGSLLTTGNTVLTNNLFGIYTTGSGIQSYVATNL